MSSYIDLAQIVQAAQQTRNGQLQQQAIERQLDREGRTQQALQAYNQGNKSLLANLDPGLLMKLEQGSRETQLAQEKIATERATRAATQRKSEDDQRLAVARELKFAANAIKDNPASYPQVRSMLMQRSQAGHLPQMNLPEQLTPEVMQQVEQFADMDLASLDPQKKPDITDEIAKRVINQTGLRPGTPEFQQAYGKAVEEERAFQLKAKKAGASSVNVGTGTAGIEPTTKAKFEQDIIADNVVSGEIKKVRSKITPGLVGLEGKANGMLGHVLDWGGSTAQDIASALGIDANKALAISKQRDALVKQTKNMGDLVLRSRSGATAPEGEQAKIQDLIGNAEHMGIQELLTTLDTFDEFLQRNSQVKSSAIAGGIQVQAPRAGRHPPQPSQPPTSHAPGQRVRVRTPEGKSATLPAEQVDAYLQAYPGAEVIQ